MREDRRLVTALFADLRGSTALAEQHDIEDVRELIGWFTHAAISAVEEFGGVVKDLAGDGVLALFGAPTTREDDPERAVRAALAFQAAMVAVSRRAATELGLADVAARVGIETGRVVAGPVGSGGHVEYGVTGDAVNVAARLQSLSPIGGVLVGPETYRQAGPHVRWGEPLLLELKGRDAPVRARVALGVTPGPDSVPAGAGAGAVAATRVVGRDRERAAVAGWLGELAGGTGRVVLVSGDAGVGKSALVRHAAAAAVASGARTWTLSSSPWESATPFAAVMPLLRDAGLQDAGADDPAGQRPAVFATVRRLAADSMSDAGLVVVAEDLHWADPSTLETVTVLAGLARSGPLLLLATTREDPGPVARLLGDSPDAPSRLHLEPMPDDDARALLEGLAEPAVLPPDIVRQVLDAAAGNPLYVQQIVRGLVDAGLRPASSAEQARSAARAAGIPASLERLIQSRLDQLDPVAAEVATAVSVLGRPFDVDLAAALLEGGASAGDTTRSTLDLLVDRGHLVRDGADYAFAHALAREVAEGTLLRGRRQTLNRLAAEAILARFGDEEASVLALHWERAGEPAKALTSHQQAADRAEAVSALLEALVHIDAAVGLAGELGRGDELMTGLLVRRARLRSRTGDARGACEDAGRAAADAEAQGRDDLRQHALEELSFALEGAVDYRAAATAQRAALELARARGDLAGQVRGHARLAINAAIGLQYAQADEHRQAALSLADSVAGARDPELLSLALDASKQVALQLGEADRLELLAVRLTQLHQGGRAVWQEQFVQLERGAIACEQARWDVAEPLVLAGLAMNRQVDDVGNEPIFHLQLGTIARARGRYAEAVALALMASTAARRGAHAEWMAWACLLLGGTHADVGDWRAAEAAARESVDWADRAGALLHAIRSQAVLARSLVHSDPGVEATRALTTCRTTLAQVTVPPGQTFLYGWEVYAAVGLLTGLAGDARQGLRTVDPVLEAAARARFQVARAELLVVRARLLLLLGDRSGARADAVQAVEVAAAHELPGIGWRACAVLAAAVDGDERVDAERSAWNISESLLARMPDGSMQKHFDRLRTEQIGGR